MTVSEEQVQYGIIANPAAGLGNLTRKKRAIERCAEILGPDTLVAGWDTASPEELRSRAQALAQEVDVLVVAGGDGTFSDIMNSVDSKTVLSYIPLGSGNAWRNTLKLPLSRRKTAEKIRSGHEHRVDLMLVDERKKGLLASVGFEGYALIERDRLLQKGIRGLDSYLRAIVLSLRGYKGEDATVEVDGRSVELKSTISLIVTKSQFYGYGLKVVPKAKLDDGLLHTLLVSGQPATTLSGIVTSLLGGNLFGEYVACRRVSITAAKELHLQIDGNLERKGSHFTFRILPGALRLRY